MQESTAQNLRAVAHQIASGQITENTPFCPEVVKRAIAIHSILSDKEWHTASEIAQSLSIGKKYVRDICQVLKEEWQLQSHRSKGWKLIKDDGCK